MGTLAWRKNRDKREVFRGMGKVKRLFIKDYTEKQWGGQMSKQCFDMKALGVLLARRGVKYAGLIGIPAFLWYVSGSYLDTHVWCTYQVKNSVDNFSICHLPNFDKTDEYGELKTIIHSHPYHFLRALYVI